MISQRINQQQIFICWFGLHIIFSFLAGPASSAKQDLVSKIRSSQSRESEDAPLLSNSINSVSEVVKPSLLRNRRSNFFSEKDHLYGNNEGLNSAFLYNDQIMQNLLTSAPSKPLSYAHSNFFLNYLKPRTTRYNAWDDHSLMHFGKRSLDSDVVNDKVVVKRSTDFWSPNNVLHFGKKSENLVKDDASSANDFDTEIGDKDSDVNTKPKNTIIAKEYSKSGDTKKSVDPWHSMMSFGKKSQSPWDHNTLHFGKKDDNLYSELNSDKRFENMWDHNTMHFGKRSDPWHNIMSFGKKSDPWHSMINFGKKSDNFWDHNTLHFGKRNEPWHNIMSFGKRSENLWDHNTLHFGKRDEWDHNTLHFGKRDPWDHNTLHFGKRDPWDHNTLHFGKKDDPWHNMMSFGKRSENLLDYNTLQLDKRDDPWHNMMSFGKKWISSDMTDLEKREDPWHNMMSFGKKFDRLWNNSITMEDKRDEPWHSMMSFGKRYGYNFDHNTLHFGKREEPWHSMMSFGKRSEEPWGYNTLHFGKKDEPWHSMMSFGKKSDPISEQLKFLSEREDYPWPNGMNLHKRPEESTDDLLEDFAMNSDPWYDHDRMMFYKKSNPWDHNTLHFGKKSNTTWESVSPTENMNSNHIQKRSADTWNDHHTMHFGKKLDPWENHNTMHFGKKSDSLENHNADNFEKKEENDDINKVGNIDKKFDWDSHNTMHFGKRDPEDYRDNLFDKRDSWDYHNTMHFGKREPWDYHNTMHFGKRDPWDYHNTMHFGKRDPFDYHNTMHFGKRNPWDYHNTMHFGKREPWDYHNTMHFGKRDPWDYHNTMHFGKRNPWDYHNTMHFGKRSKSNLKDENIISVDRNIEQSESKSSIKDNGKDMDSKSDKKELNIKKRSFTNFKTNSRSNNKKVIKESPHQSFDKSKFHPENKDISQPLEHVKSTIKIETIENDDKKLDYSSTASKNKEENVKPSITKDSLVKDYPKDNSIRQMKEKESHIKKRSVTSNSFMNKNTYLNDKYSEDISDNVLHFGKRSIEVPDDNEGQWLNEEKVKRFDDFWNDHNTLHFGKKSDIWDNHNTLHFGKKSNTGEVYAVIPSSKRDPWEYLNTLHFGKKFDPWDGHAKMHFGKRTDNWDHNVMHFGKRDQQTSDEFRVPSSLEDFDSVQLNDYLQSINSEDDDSAESDDILGNLVIVKSIINSHLKDDSIPFEERVNLLKHYLKPILKAIINDKELSTIPFSEANTSIKENDPDEIFGGDQNMIFNPVNEIKYDEDAFKKGNDDSSYGEYGDSPKKDVYLQETEYPVKSKRKYVGKAELKRHFIPFQGPKSIVYPQAWFASQIRRSSLPRTSDYARHMEMRMAEKKEDPFNSYMHFG